MVWFHLLPRRSPRTSGCNPSLDPEQPRCMFQGIIISYCLIPIPPPQTSSEMTGGLPLTLDTG